MDPYTMMERDIPAWYELGLAGANPIVTLSSETAARVGFALSRRREDAGLKSQQLAIAPFVDYEPASALCRWGFGGCAIAKNDGCGNVRMLFEIPPVITGAAEGSWSTGLATAATLKFLFWALQTSYVVPAAGRPQLFVVSTHIELRDCYGAPIMVKASRAVSDWMRRHQPTRLPPIEQAMELAHSTMWPMSLARDECCFVYTPPHWFRLECPGNACGLGPDFPSQADDVAGYELSPHNTDSAIQQLTLLVDIAALHQHIRNNP